MIALPKVIAHRGAKAYAPENTLTAFKKAKALGASWVEFDVMLTKDGVPVVFHDESLRRTTNGKGRMDENDYDTIRVLDAGRWFSRKYKGETIPTLEAVIACLKEIELAANIEIKPCGDTHYETTIAVLSAVAEHWPDNLPPPIVSSFNLDCLTLARSINPDIQIALLLDKWREDWQKIADELSCVSVNLNHKIATKERVEAIKKTDRLVLSYTVNRKGRAKKLFKWGVDSVFSDYPDLMVT